MISNIKSEKKKNDMNDVVEEEINKLKEENATFRQELVLSQALINSLQTELKNNLNNENKIYITLFGNTCYIGQIHIL